MVAQLGVIVLNRQPKLGQNDSKRLYPQLCQIFKGLRLTCSPQILPSQRKVSYKIRGTLQLIALEELVFHVGAKCFCSLGSFKFWRLLPRLKEISGDVPVTGTEFPTLHEVIEIG